MDSVSVDLEAHRYHFSLALDIDMASGASKHLDWGVGKVLEGMDVVHKHSEEVAGASEERLLDNCRCPTRPGISLWTSLIRLSFLFQTLALRPPVTFSFTLPPSRCEAWSMPLVGCILRLICSERQGDKQARKRVDEIYA